MNRAITALIAVVFVFAVVAFGGVGSSTARASVAAPDACSSCHKVSENIPEGHSKANLSTVSYCLMCHTKAGAAPGFVWTSHQKHYGPLVTPGFTGDCWSCHTIDSAGNFQVIGSSGGQIKVTRETVNKMTPYYKLAANSKFLGSTHAKVSVTCETCHGVPFPEKAPAKEQCFKCHGSYDAIAELAPIHYSAIYPHHQSDPVECADCHHAHKASELVCNMCHSFDDVVP